MSDGAASLSHLLARAELVEDRVRALVQRRRADDPAPDDPFRGLYVNEQTVDRLLEATADPAGRGGRRRRWLRSRPRPTGRGRRRGASGCAGWPGTPG